MKVSLRFFVLCLTLLLWVSDASPYVQQLQPPKLSSRGSHPRSSTQVFQTSPSLGQQPSPPQDHNDQPHFVHHVPSINVETNVHTEVGPQIPEKKAPEHSVDLDQEEKRLKSSLANLIVFVGGVANVVSYKTVGFYASMMTGNTMRCCTALADARWRDATFFAGTILSYTAGAGLFRFLTILKEKRQETTEQPRTSNQLGRLSVAAFLIFAAADVVMRLLPLPKRYLGCFLALGFGFVNAVSVDETGVITWAATGHVNKIGMALVDKVVLGETKPATRNSIRVLSIFLAAVATTAALYDRVAAFLSQSGGVLRFFPPLGTCFGIAYAAILGGYNVQKQKRRIQHQASQTKRMDDTGLPIVTQGWDPLLIWWSSFYRNESTETQQETTSKVQ